MKHFDMAIQQYMGILKVIFCIGLVFIIKGVASIEDKKTQEEFIGQLFDPSSGILTEHTAEVLWLTCWEDLVHLKKENGDLDLCLAEEPTKRTNEISLEVGSIARENIQKLINGCYPQLKEKVLNCLRKNNLQFNVHKEENDFKTWHATNIESLSSRRYLGHVFPQHISEISIKAEDEDKKKSKSSKDEASGPPVAIIGVVALVGVALLFLCCFLLCGSGQDSQNDERPLLSMSMTDYSVGSASNNNLHKISMKEDNNRALSSNNILVDDNKISVEETESVEVDSVGVRPSFELKPPPGRSIGDGLPPLKPPPGRPDLALPPPPGRTDLPLPPPPGRPDLALPPPPGRPDLALPPPPGRPDLAPPAPEPPISNPSNTNAPRPPPPPPRSSSSPSAPAPPRPPSNAPPPPPPPGGRGPPPPPPPGGRGPPPPPGNGPRPPPPPPGKGGAGPRPPGPPPPRGAPKPPPFGSKRSKSQDDVLGGSEIEYSGPAKAKLKPFFWDKVQANNDQTMVWNQLKAGSFQFNEEMMETLFGYTAAPADKNKGPQKKEAAQEAAPQFIQIINGKKAQNLSILLKALNVTIEEVCDALLEGNELPTEFLQTLLKMAPTQEEELKLRLYNGSLAQLGPADRFLKAVVDISFSYKRMEALLYMGTLHEELKAARDSFAVLEVACRTLRSSRLFLKLLEAVLKTGNRMNDGTFRGGAQAFKLDTLLKLSDVKGVDGKTTLLHFVVQEIMRTEGIRAARMEKESLSFSSIKTDDLLEDVNLESEDHYRELGLQAVSRLSTELENVKKAAAIDADGLVGTTLRLGHGIVKTKEFLKNDVSNMNDDKGFGETVKSFVEKAEGDVKSLLEEEKKIMALVKSTGDYFHGDTGKDEGLRLFAIVRDFLIMLDKVCREIKANAQKKPAPAKSGKQETSNNQKPKGSSSSESNPPPPSATPDIRQRIAPAIANRRVDDFSSDEDSP